MQHHLKKTVIKSAPKKKCKTIIDTCAPLIKQTMFQYTTIYYIIRKVQIEG